MLRKRNVALKNEGDSFPDSIFYLADTPKMLEVLLCRKTVNKVPIINEVRDSETIVHAIQKGLRIDNYSITEKV